MNGTLATFWVMWLVTASSITEPIAESASHSSWSLSGTGAACSFTTWASWPFMDIQALAAQRSAKPAKRTDQPQPSWLEVEQRLEQHREAEQRQ